MNCTRTTGFFFLFSDIRFFFSVSFVSCSYRVMIKIRERNNIRCKAFESGGTPLILRVLVDCD